MIESLLATIQQRLDDHYDLYLGTSLGKAKVIRSLTYENNQIQLSVGLGFPCADYQARLAADLTDLIVQQASDVPVKVVIQPVITAHRVASNIKAIPRVKNVIAVGSGKGGVGKSTVTVNLACALQQAGASVAILDADIYGPSQPAMLGAPATQAPLEGEKLVPVRQYGMQSMSIGYLVDNDSPMIWRGPMVSGALQQLLYETQWDPIDYLLVDLPPGTGDIQLTLAQKIPVTGAVIVTTPQDIALLDARKAYGMFSKVKIPVLGVLENMSVHICPNCHHASHIFGDGGGARMAQQFQVPLLGQLPLATQIQQDVDRGLPTVLAATDSEYAECFRHSARMLTARLSLTAKDYSHKFPNIVVENN